VTPCPPYDLIVCALAIHHASDRAAAFADVNRGARTRYVRLYSWTAHMLASGSSKKQ